MTFSITVTIYLNKSFTNSKIFCIDLFSNNSMKYEDDQLIAHSIIYRHWYLHEEMHKALNKEDNKAPASM